MWGQNAMDLLRERVMKEGVTGPRETPATIALYQNHQGVLTNTTSRTLGESDPVQLW